jgi:DNA-binding transcriptional LysR family regulator
MRRTTKGVSLTEAGSQLAETIVEMSEAAFRARIAFNCRPWMI